MGTLQCVCLVSMQATRGPGIGVADGCQLSGGCWELSTSILEEKHALLSTKPSL